jgi:YggT family protein
MADNFSNAFFHLVTYVFNIVMWVWLLGVILQWSRADFYNPVSQLTFRLTRFPTDALRRVLPPWRNINIAALLVLFVLAVIYVLTAAWLLNLSIGAVTVVLQALFKLIALTLDLYTLTIVVQAILSWLGPGVNNPASNILWSMNEPILRPVRRWIPPVSGLDISPVIVILALQFLVRLIPLSGYFR